MVIKIERVGEMEKVKVGVAGIGLMGDLHTRVYQSLPDVEVVGVYEADMSRKKEIENRYSVKVFDTLDEMLSQVYALSVCTPDNLHKDIILKAFENKVKVLVENHWRCLRRHVWKFFKTGLINIFDGWTYIKI